MIGSGYEQRSARSDRSEGAAAPEAPAGPRLKVYELTKELGTPHKELVAKIRAIGVEVANHMSQLEPIDVDRIRRVVARERHDSLVEERLNDTVIRRRSKSVPAAP